MRRTWKRPVPSQQNAKQRYVPVAGPEYHAFYHDVSHNPLLGSQGIKLDPWAISVEQLRKEAWQIIEPKYHDRLAQHVDHFQEAQSKQLGASDLTDVAQALIAGRAPEFGRFGHNSPKSGDFGYKFGTTDERFFHSAADLA